MFNSFRYVFNNSLYNVTRNYAFKSDLKIKWVRPTKILCYKPEKSGDLSPLPAIPKSTIQFDFQRSKELETYVLIPLIIS